MSDFKAPEKGIVSVIIAGMAGTDRLEPTLRSAAAQTYRFTEIVCVEGGGSAAWKEIVEGATPTARWIGVDSRGLPEARSAGVHATNGQFVAFLDPGDSWEPDRIERQMALMIAHPDLGLVFSRAAVPGGAGAGGRTRESPGRGEAWEAVFGKGIALRDPADTYTRLLQRNFVPYSTILARRVDLPTDGPFRAHLRFADEYDFLLRISELKRFAFVDASLARCAEDPEERLQVETAAFLETLGVFRDNLARNLWLLRKDPSGIGRRESSLLKGAARALTREGRGGEARKLLVEAWRKRPLDVTLPGYLLATVGGTSR
jgi:glycosyltransferase involved in cell wall biosynthesis